MKTIGLIGGMSWESSLLYYQYINENIKKLAGETHSAKILMYSFDFNEIESLMRVGKWDEIEIKLLEVSKKLQEAGADFLVICTNTMHKFVPILEEKIKIPFLHIADATAIDIQNKGLKKVALLGTNFTMSEGFYADRIKEKFGIDVIIPEENDKKTVHDIIFNELILGKFTKESKENYIEIINKLIKKGAEGIILGCTEIPLLISANDVDTVLFDTTKLHSWEAAKLSVK